VVFTGAGAGGGATVVDTIVERVTDAVLPPGFTHMKATHPISPRFNIKEIFSGVFINEVANKKINYQNITGCIKD
jgi:hypothetical protein